jgi:AhpD family alkylhydroperoxidase
MAVGWTPQATECFGGFGRKSRSSVIFHNRFLSDRVYYSIERRNDMEPRIDPRKTSPGALKAMFGLEQYVRSCGLDEKLLLLVKFRVSQINGCAYCLDMHSKDLRTAGETEQRLYLLDAWRESPFYNERERAALAWAEAVTLVADSHVPDEVFEQTRNQFTDEELINLTLAVVAINGWNRLSISLRAVPGSYQPHQYAELVKQMAA